MSDGVTQILKFDLDGCWEKKKHNSESASDAQQRRTSLMTRTFGFPQDRPQVVVVVVGGLAGYRAGGEGLRLL